MCFITEALPQTGDGTLYIQYRNPITSFLKNLVTCLKFLKILNSQTHVVPQWFQTKDCGPVIHSVCNQIQ